MKMSGHIYVIKDEPYERYKIGKTTGSLESLRKRYKTYNPNVNVLKFVECSDIHTTEKIIHKYLEKYRVNNSEWFETNIRKIREAFNKIFPKQVNNTKHETSSKNDNDNPKVDLTDYLKNVDLDNITDENKGELLKILQCQKSSDNINTVITNKQSILKSTDVVSNNKSESTDKIKVSKKKDVISTDKSESIDKIKVSKKKDVVSTDKIKVSKKKDVVSTDASELTDKIKVSKKKDVVSTDVSESIDKIKVSKKKGTLSSDKIKIGKKKDILLSESIDKNNSVNKDDVSSPELTDKVTKKDNDYDKIKGEKSTESGVSKKIKHLVPKNNIHITIDKKLNSRNTDEVDNKKELFCKIKSTDKSIEEELNQNIEYKSNKYDKYSKKELIEIAKEKGISGITGKNKDQLCKLIGLN